MAEGVAGAHWVVHQDLTRTEETMHLRHREVEVVRRIASVGLGVER